MLNYARNGLSCRSLYFWKLIIPLLGLVLSAYSIRTFVVHEIVTIPIGSRLYVYCGSVMGDHLSFGWEIVPRGYIADRFYQRFDGPDSQFMMVHGQCLGASFSHDGNTSFQAKVPLSTCVFLLMILMGLSLPGKRKRPSRAFFVLAAVSLTTAMVFVALSATSFFRSTTVVAPSGRWMFAYLDLAEFAKSHETQPKWSLTTAPVKWNKDYERPESMILHFTLFGIVYGEFGDDSPGVRIAYVPITLPAFFATPLPALWVKRRLGRQK